MNRILKSTLAATFAMACIAGSGIAFAGDNNSTSMDGDKANTPRMNSDMKTDPSHTGSIKCDDSNANINSGCDKPGHLKQEDN